MISIIIDKKSLQSKVQQLVEGIQQAINRQEVLPGGMLPSVSSLCEQCSLSRDTVVKAYAELKRRGVVISVPQKGYYVAGQELRVFMLMDDFSSFKADLYRAFCDKLPKNAMVDLYFHHHNIKTFETLIRDNVGCYQNFIVMSFDHPEIVNLLALIPPGQLLVLDMIQHVSGSQSYLGQDFEQGIMDALKSIAERVKHYKKIVFVKQKEDPHPDATMVGIDKFCRTNRMDFIFSHELKRENICRGTLFIVVRDDIVVDIIQQCDAQGLKIGDEVGLLAFNDSPLRSVTNPPVSSLSVDFNAMGEAAAQYVLRRQSIQKTMPLRVVLRQSF